jgi:hypothetical protein
MQKSLKNTTKIAFLAGFFAKKPKKAKKSLKKPK